MTVDEIMARAAWIAQADFPGKEARWDTPGAMLDIDQEPYEAIAATIRAELDKAGYVIVPREPSE